jgi:hypothetical protein
VAQRCAPPGGSTVAERGVYSEQVWHIGPGKESCPEPPNQLHHKVLWSIDWDRAVSDARLGP